MHGDYFILEYIFAMFSSGLESFGSFCMEYSEFKSETSLEDVFVTSHSDKHVVYRNRPRGVE